LPTFNKFILAGVHPSLKLAALNTEQHFEMQQKKFFIQSNSKKKLSLK